MAMLVAPRGQLPYWDGGATVGTHAHHSGWRGGAARPVRHLLRVRWRRDRRDDGDRPRVAVEERHGGLGSVVTWKRTDVDSPPRHCETSPAELPVEGRPKSGLCRGSVRGHEPPPSLLRRS